MSRLSSEAAATSSPPALNTPRFRLLRNLTRLVGDSIAPASEQTTGPLIPPEESSQVPQDIDVSRPGYQDLAIGPSTATAATTTTLSITIPDTRSIKIPYIRRTTYIFPEASDRISLAHRDRYPSLKDIFQRNIEESRELSEFTRYISYELRLCGPCLADAIPSIVVFCPLKTLKKLKSLLTQHHIRRQCEPETNNPDSVGFGLLFWGQPVEMLAMHEVTLLIPEKQETGSVLGDATIGRAPWAVHITDSDGGRCTATMGCMIQVAGARFGLTTAHAFCHPWTTSPGAYDIDSDESDTDDDYDYDTVTEQDDHVKAATKLPPASPLNDAGEEVRLGKAQVHIPPLDDTSAWAQGHASLDFALVDLGSGEDLFRTTHELSIATHLPKQCLEVLIMTRAHLGIPATLYNIPSYLGGVKSPLTAEVWTLGCVPGNIHMRKGDSGSLVYDARSGELYGMVMAANPFGDIHIVPLTAIVEQVKEWFQTQYVIILNLPRDSGLSTVAPGVEAKKTAEEQKFSNFEAKSESQRAKSKGSDTLLESYIYSTQTPSEVAYQGPPKTFEQRRQEMLARLENFDQFFGGRSTR